MLKGEDERRKFTAMEEIPTKKGEGAREGMCRESCQEGIETGKVKSQERGRVSETKQNAWVEEDEATEVK